MIQSSGSGKSRLVDEVAKKVFAIPFNLREQCDDPSSKLFPYLVIRTLSCPIVTLGVLIPLPTTRYGTC